MRSLLRRRRPEHADPDLPAVSQPAPLAEPPARSPNTGVTVSELSELEARAICAREGIAVFWPRPKRDKGT
ncbi:hypothetical protein QTH97_08795 [Variovorax sp. J22R24]|uniref:hypothetical protein n=1 Tax=Variovorax gracilis TaxID=3053502 RepID=UPI0025789434|nr:hypothetical protein [Variovorax sp. J22R24]MDM0105028.1 hypothetical protein [Variovorax sp. J22R24]